MLGSRTKLVNSYGKRKNRIVSVDDNYERSKASIDIFQDMEVVEIKPLVSRMKKRENMTPTKPKPSSPRRVHMSKKKRLSPLLKRNHVNQLIEEMIGKKPVEMEVGDITENTPLRAPLAPFSLNAPASPMVPPKQAAKKLHSVPRKSRTTNMGQDPISSTPKKVIPSESKLANRMKRRQTSFSKEVQVIDIIVIDADGTPVKKERRTSRKNVAVPAPKKEHLPDEAITIQSIDSESCIEVRKPRTRAQKIVVVISDSEDSGAEEAPESRHWQNRASLPRSGSRGHKGLQVEVVVPPAPYRTSGSMKSITQRVSGPSPNPAADPAPQLPAPLLNNHRFNHISSPVAKPRQLTPIRRGATKSLFPNRPSSPAYGSSSLTEVSIADLSLELEELSLNACSDFEASLFPGNVEQAVPEYLKPLLAECHQSAWGPVDFSSFIETFPFDPVVSSESRKRPKDLSFKKIGEASYSEVFGIGDVVLKVIPLRDESPAPGKGNQTTSVEDGPAETDTKDVLREIIVTRAMGDVCGGFVELLKTYVVKGKYPEVLLGLWDEYRETRGSESVRPDTFLVSQTYAIVVLPNGGPDLEAFRFTNANKNGWKQASSLFWQVAKALAKAEQLVSFEHRDLHWGQILVKTMSGLTSSSPLSPRDTNLPLSTAGISRVPMDHNSHGIHATLIDLGLARMDAGDGSGGEMVHWTKFDEEIFMGEGDYQFDVYRIMRNHVRDNWAEFRPLTNVMWLHYLVLKLLYSKGLKPPINRTSASRKSLNPNVFTEKECYDSLVDIERWLAERVALVSPQVKKPAKKPRGRPRKTALHTPAVEDTVNATADRTNAVPSCAGEVVAYAIKRGWLEDMPM